MSVRTPRLKILRRLGTPLPGLTRKSAERKPAPPGQHGASAGRRRPSAYRRSLEEKQKVRHNYGVTERQMRRYMERARVMPDITSANLLSLLERRLDNVVFRLGIAPTIPAARQLVSHGHIAVNGQRLDRPGYEVGMGDHIARTDRSRHAAAEQSLLPAVRLPGYLAQESEGGGGRMIAPPSRADILLILDDALIVEFYSR